MSDRTAAKGAALSPRARRGYRERLRLLPAAEVIQVMARREAGRLLFWDRARQGLVIGLSAACLLALFIPLHRTFGAAGGRVPPYLYLYSVAIQVGLLLLSAHAVWAGTRHDAASGSLEEVVLTGAPPQALLLGKWLGTSVAGAVWAVMLLPALFLAGAFTGAAPVRLLAVTACWAATPAVGAMAGALTAFSERSAGGGSVWFLVQGWVLLRLTAPKFAASGGVVTQELVYWLHQVDPMTMVPAALGRFREPWLLKIGFLALVLLAVVVWLAGAERELPETAAAPSKKAPVELLSLRPLRAWMTSAIPGATLYDRDVLFRFERAHGWRLRVSPPAWLFLLAFTFLPAVPAAILGPENRSVGSILAGADVLVAATVAALGMAASVAAEKEQGRWTSLLCLPRGAGEILLAKWRAVWLETWPVWAVAAVRSLLLAWGGSLSWEAVPLALLGPPAVAAAAAAVVGALSLTSPSLSAAQQRALLWVFAPPLLAVAARLLLPRLAGLEWLSPAHGVAALELGGGGIFLGLLPLLAYAALGAAALGWAIRRLRTGAP